MNSLYVVPLEKALVHFSHSFMSEALQTQGLQNTRLPCPSLSPRVCANSYQLSWSCHPSISFSATPFSFCPKSFPASESYPVSWRVASGGQSTRASPSVSVLLMKIQGWFPLRLIGLISLLSKGHARVFSSTTVWKHQFFGTLLSFLSSSHIHIWLLERP